MVDPQSQRRSPRCSFVLTAEVTDENSRTLIARLRHLNLYGCYLEVSNPLSERSSITIKVTAGKTVFQARGRVVYSDRNNGSGVEFEGIAQPYRAVLQKWLTQHEITPRSDENH
jgi:hypothetical protein